MKVFGQTGYWQQNRSDTSLTMQQIDPCNVDNSLEDCIRHQNKFLKTANALHVKGGDKYTQFVHCNVFIITGGIIPSITEMSTDEYGLRSIQVIDPVNLRMSSRQWEKLGYCRRAKHLIMHQCMELIFPMRKMQSP
jgi:hypothetical protein